MIKNGVVKYVKLMKKLFIIFSCVALPALMVCLVFAFRGYIAFMLISAAVAVCYFIVYGFYTLRVSLGTVTEIQVTNKVVHLKTKRKVYTYDVHYGCVEMKAYKNRFVGTFETQDSRDKFIFYTHAPFSRYTDDQFSEDDLRDFFPAIDELER